MAEKKIKEVKALPATEEPVKKKRASGKRKPKPKIEEVQEEEVSLNPQEETLASEEIDTPPWEVDEVLVQEEVTTSDKKLSSQADGWRKWLAYQRMTPDEFVKRYPTHKMRHFIDEIIAFNTQK